MTVNITFELEEEDLAHFREIMRRARESASDMDFHAIVRTASDMAKSLRNGQVPKYVEERLNGLDRVIAMALDEEWLLPEEDAARLTDALAYFCEPEDLIPDDTPGIGFLDDAIMMELVTRELKPELDAHADFCAFRDKQAARRQSDGNVTRAQWLDAKRAELHHEASRTRAARNQSGLFSSIFSIL